MKVLIYLFLLGHSFLSYVGSNRYCSSDICNNSNQHILCKFQSEDPARHCREYERTITTEKERQAILNKLNSRRNKIASGGIRSLPSAEVMMKLHWNKELETSAQRWADQCVKHNVPDIKDTCRDLGKVFVEQNIATISGDSPGLTPLSLADVWYMELLNTNASVLSQYRPSAESGFAHYDYFTQLVWAETSEVGCGGVKFKDSVPERNRTIYRLVCNFAPGGNHRNRSVYPEGFPCSRCGSGYCDYVYTALCNSNTTNNNMLSEHTKPEKTVEIKSPLSTKQTIRNVSILAEVLKSTSLNFETRQVEDEEVYTAFDYFSHLNQFSTQILTTTTSPVTCKDALAVDDFIELLKRKLSSDSMLKELLQSTKVPFHNDGGYTDASVAALVSRIYSKKISSTTTRSSESEYVNSTLLVDLVEAVIFRKGDKIRSATTDLKTEFDSSVNPVRIKAQLAEVKQNSDFTGHYFFPEDDVNEEDLSSEITESYYDFLNPPTSEVELEIEELKRNRATRDFLDEILESESATEPLTNKDNFAVNEYKQKVKNLMDNNEKYVNYKLYP